MKPVVTRNLMLNFISEAFSVEEKVNSARVFEINTKDVKDGDIVYVMSRELRVEDNFGLNFSLELCKKYAKKLKIVIYLDKKIISERQLDFLNDNLQVLKENLKFNNYEYKIVTESVENELKSAGAVVFDFNPVEHYDFLKNIGCKGFEVDSHNIIPARFISNKQEFSAATLRRKVYANIGGFLTEFPDVKIAKQNVVYRKLENFIENELQKYPEDKNNPNKNAVSGLSPYLHFGFISAQKVALEVVKSSVSSLAKEAFLEELIVRKELADNFCLYSNDFKSFDSIFDWAKETLLAHKDDMRTYVYTKEDFENSKTHDSLWNSAQIQLVKEGRIHGFLRMYWAKKILEWSVSAKDALDIAIYLNDKYALDGNDSNGYVGILWSIGGLHDRAFANRQVFGKIRYMSLEGCKKKFDVSEFIKKYS